MRIWTLIPVCKMISYHLKNFNADVQILIRLYFLYKYKSYMNNNETAFAPLKSI